jgi:hypothetical protein
MMWTARACSIILLAVSGIAVAAGGGTFTVMGTTTALMSAYAYSRPDPFDASKQTTVIVFSERELDTAKINAATDRVSALSHATDDLTAGQEHRSAAVEIFIARDDPRHPVQQIGFDLPGLSSSASTGPDNYTLQLKRNDGMRIEGTFKSTKESAKNAEHGGFFDLHFELDVASTSTNPK